MQAQCKKLNPAKTVGINMQIFSNPFLTKIHFSVNLDLNSETFVSEFHVITVLMLICICLYNLFASIVLGLFLSHLSEREILKLKLVDLSLRSISTFKVVLFSLISKGNFSLSNNSITQVSAASVSHEQLVVKGVWTEVGKADGKPVV